MKTRALAQTRSWILTGMLTGAALTLVAPADTLAQGQSDNAPAVQAQQGTDKAADLSKPYTPPPKELTDVHHISNEELKQKISEIWNHRDLNDLGFIAKTFSVQFSEAKIPGYDQEHYEQTAVTTYRDLDLVYKKLLGFLQSGSKQPETSLIIRLNGQNKPLQSDLAKWADPQQIGDGTLTLSVGVEPSSTVSEITLSQYRGKPPRDFNPIYELKFNSVTPFIVAPTGSK